MGGSCSAASALDLGVSAGLQSEAVQTRDGKSEGIARVASPAFDFILHGGVEKTANVTLECAFSGDE